MKKKSISGKALDVDVAKRQVKVYFSEFGGVDLDGDMILTSAFTKSIKERGRKGADLIWHLSNHRCQPEYCLGKPELSTDTKGLIGITEFVDTTHALDVIKMYDAGLINQHSIGFNVVKGEPKATAQGGRYYEIAEVKLYEGSTVLWGANPNTPTVEVKSLAELTEHFDNLTKALKSGTFTDELFVELEQQYKQLGDLILQRKKSTQPPKGTEPAATDVSQLKGFFNDLFTTN